VKSPTELPQILNPLLTIIQTAKILGVTDRTVWALTKQGQLPSIKIGHSRRYSQEDVQAYIDRQRVLQPLSVQGTTSTSQTGKDS
jgi:excisionase family DNA binding protein